MNKNKRLVQNKLVNKQDVIKGIPAVLGNNEYAVNVPGKPGFVYARIDEHVFEVFNDQVAAIPGIPVLIGYDHLESTHYKVLGVRHIQNHASQHQSDSHHESHEWMNKNGGTDVVFVHQRQILPLRVTPAGGMNIWVHSAVILAGGELREIAPGDVVDLSSHLPTGEDEGRFVLVSIDESGDVAVTAGTAKTVSSLALSDVPERPSGHRMIAAIRLYAGQTEIKESRLINDLVDLRWAQSGESAGDLGELRDVVLTDPTDREVLVFDPESEKWINKTFIEADIALASDLTSHVFDADNPHEVTKTQIGLANVTNDAQLKREAGDWDEFTEKTTLHDNDLFLIEDSENGGIKKKVKRSEINPASDSLLEPISCKSGNGFEIVFTRDGEIVWGRSLTT